MNRKLMILMLVLAVLIAGCVNNRPVNNTQNQAMTHTASEARAESGLIGGSVSKYYEWDKAKFDQAVKEGKTIYLEFSADWCGICQKQEPHLKAGFAELNDLNVVGFKIHYNDGQTTLEHKALAKQYQIVYQHTKVIIKNGKVVLKSPEGWEKDRFVMEMRKIQHA